MFELKEITDDFTTHSFIVDPRIVSYVLPKLRDIYDEYDDLDTFFENGFFIVDIEEPAKNCLDPKECYDVWLYHSSYGYKTYMFGLPKATTSFDECKDIILANLYSENYILDYCIEELERSFNVHCCCECNKDCHDQSCVTPVVAVT